MRKKNSAKNAYKQKKLKRALKENIPSSNFDIWLDKQDVMLEFHISEKTLFNWRTKRILPYTRLGGKIMYNRSLLEQMLKNGLNH